MASLDRTEIAPLMTQYFPMEGKSSDEWHGFMNRITGLSIAPDVPNGVAFDQWRQELAKQGLPVWGYSPERLDKIKSDAERLQKHQAELLSKQDATLAALRKAAPDVSAKDLIEAAARVAKGK